MDKIYDVEVKIINKISKKVVASSGDEAIDNMEKQLEIYDIIDKDINEYYEISSVESDEKEILKEKENEEEIIIIFPEY